jgi:hypothetical protein
MKTVSMTASANATVAASSVSPSSGTANSIDRKGCSSCTWLTRSAPPRASARYHAKKPSHMENSDTYRKPPQADAGTGCVGHSAAVTGSVTGSDSTSTHEITCCGGMALDSRAPLT